MAAEDAGRAARRIEQHRVGRRRRRPCRAGRRRRPRPTGRCARDCREVAPDDFPRRRPRSPPSPPRRAAASCRPARRTDRARVPAPAPDQPRGQRGGDILHPPRALVEAGQLGHRRALGEADMAGQQADAAEFARPARRSRRIGKRQVERRRRGDRARGGRRPSPRPRPRASAARPPSGSVGTSGSVALAAHQRAEHAVDELARAAIDQRQRGRDRGMRRRAEHQRLDQRDAQREARLGVVGQRSLRAPNRSARRDRAGGAASRRRWHGRARDRRRDRSRGRRGRAPPRAAGRGAAPHRAARSAARRAGTPGPSWFGASRLDPLLALGPI